MGSQRGPQVYSLPSEVSLGKCCVSREEIIHSIKAESILSDSNSGFHENKKELRVTKMEDFNSILQWTAVDFKWGL